MSRILSGQRPARRVADAIRPAPPDAPRHDLRAWAWGLIAAMLILAYGFAAGAIR